MACERGSLADLKLCFHKAEIYFVEKESKTWELFALFLEKTERYFLAVLYYKTAEANSLTSAVGVMIIRFNRRPIPQSHSAVRKRRN